MRGFPRLPAYKQAEAALHRDTLWHDAYSSVMSSDYDISDDDGAYYDDDDDMMDAENEYGQSPSPLARHTLT